MLQIPQIQRWQHGSMTSPSHWCMPFRIHTLKMTWHINGCAMLSRWWWRMSSLSTPIVVSDPPPPFLFSHQRQTMLQPTTVEQWRHTMNTYEGQQLGEQHEFPTPCFSHIPSRGHIALGNMANNRRTTMIHTHPVCTPIPYLLQPFSLINPAYFLESNIQPPPQLVPHSPCG